MEPHKRKTEKLPQIRVNSRLSKYLRDRAEREMRPISNLMGALLEQARMADKTQQPAA